MSRWVALKNEHAPGRRCFSARTGIAGWREAIQRNAKLALKLRQATVTQSAGIATDPTVASGTSNWSECRALEARVQADRDERGAGRGVRLS